ncbi:MAG: hypothetical protein DRG78_10825 [Epsilonproteobacteria bacterium]|nr:MAG: hypothetical protein DRG78_10825 [Campylobacterota bacterium]
MDIVLSLVFSAPLLIIMVYPAMKITEFLDKRMTINDKIYDKLTVIITIVLSLICGVLLHIT